MHKGDNLAISQNRFVLDRNLFLSMVCNTALVQRQFILYFVNSIVVFYTDETLKFSLGCITLQWICILSGRGNLFFSSNIFCNGPIYHLGFWSENVIVKHQYNVHENIFKR